MTRSLAPSTLLALTLLLPLTACEGDDGGGNDEIGDGDGDPTTTGDGDGDPTGDGDGDPTGDGDGDGDGDPFVDNSTYSAVIMPGVPDRITIQRVNNDEPTCTHMVLYRPGFDTFDIDMPMGWAIEEAMVWQQGFCPMDLANPHGTPMSGTGTISVGSWDALMTYPCSLNFDIEVDNATDPPSMSTWEKNGVPVTGINCG